MSEEETAKWELRVLKERLVKYERILREEIEDVGKLGLDQRPYRLGEYRGLHLALKLLQEEMGLMLKKEAAK